MNQNVTMFSQYEPRICDLSHEFKLSLKNRKDISQKATTFQTTGKCTCLQQQLEQTEEVCLNFAFVIRRCQHAIPVSIVCLGLNYLFASI